MIIDCTVARPRPPSIAPLSLPPVKQIRAAIACVVVSTVVAPRPLAAQARDNSPHTAPFTVAEASIDELRRALEQKRTTSHELVQQYLVRIATYEDQLHAIV